MPMVMMMMMKKVNLLLPFVFHLLLILARVSVQSPSPQPSLTSTAINITSVLEKAGEFIFFIRLLKMTQVSDHLNSQINCKSTQGLTVFAPNDNSFSSLSSGTLISLSDQQKIHLIPFHVLPMVISLSQFQTASNHLRTQAGDSVEGQFPLNVSTYGNQVNLTIGVVTARIGSTMFSNSKLAIYLVDKVLIPMAMSKSFPPAPLLAKPGEDSPTSESGAPTTSRSDSINVSAGILLKESSYVLLAIFSVMISLSFSISSGTIPSLMRINRMMLLH